MKRARLAVLLVFVLAIPASADEFGSLVKGIESHYGIRRIHPHLIGFALFLAKPAMWGSGAGGLRVAVFENENGTFKPSAEAVDRIMLSSLGPNWRPFVRVHSRRNGENTIIYADCSSNKMHMLIAAIEQNELTLVRLRVKGKGIRRWMADPESEAKTRKH
jgi:hypothetical protein